MVWNWLRRHPFLVDTVIALLLNAVYVASAVHGRHWLGVPLAALATLPLTVRRRYPIAVLAVVSGATFAYTAAYENDIPIAVALAIYTCAAHLGRRRSLWASAVAAAAVLLVTAAATASYGQLIPDALIFIAAWVLGDNLGTRRAYTDALEERAERLEREREAEQARAVAEEQARIARELHDVIAHTISVIVVQAAAANDVFDSRPENARQALRDIETAGRGALAELRRLLGVLRAGETDFAPQPGLDRLDDLVANVRAAGLQVGLSIEGTPRPLPAGVDLSAYRVVQEALTNTLKHAEATHADVTLRFDADAVAVEVRDDGDGTGNGAAMGHGLVGMRERVGIFGGSLAAGPAAGGGFAVAAHFPLTEHTR